MNFINGIFLFAVLSISLPVYSQSGTKPEQKTPLQICAEKKLKDFRVRNLVSVADEPIYLDKFKQVCAKEQMTSSSDQQTKDAAARAEKDKKTTIAPTKPASADQTTAAPPKPPTSGSTPTASSPPSNGSGSGGFVVGGCGTPEQCAAYMAESSRIKYTWSSPQQQIYFGELWGNSFDYAAGLGGTFEQPESACSEKNQGEIIAFDMGTEVRPIACMSNRATQEEIKKMAEKIKNVKVETLPVVVAVKRAQYEWKVITEAAKLGENEMRICTGPGNCGTDNVGVSFTGGPGCAVVKCIRIDGGPVKVAKKEEKKDEKKDDKKVDPIMTTMPVPSSGAAREPAQQNFPTPTWQGYDPERDGAAGP